MLGFLNVTKILNVCGCEAGENSELTVFRVDLRTYLVTVAEKMKCVTHIEIEEVHAI